MKPPQGMGIVVATMDIQNWGEKRSQDTLSTTHHTHTLNPLPAVLLLLASKLTELLG